LIVTIDQVKYDLLKSFESKQVVHIWTPNHPDTRQRSHVDRVILLLQIEDKYVPISESAVEVIGDHAP